MPFPKSAVMAGVSPNLGEGFEGSPTREPVGSNEKLTLVPCAQGNTWFVYDAGGQFCAETLRIHPVTKTAMRAKIARMARVPLRLIAILLNGESCARAPRPLWQPLARRPCRWLQIRGSGMNPIVWVGRWQTLRFRRSRRLRSRGRNQDKAGIPAY